MPARTREDRSNPLPLLAIGALGALAARRLLAHAILLELRRCVRALNAGDYRPLLAQYADDAVLVFHDGEHRWAGEHRGKPAIERFLRDFVGAGVQGEIVEFYFAGAPWAITLIVRFDDHADAPDGERLYRNRAALIARTRWGKIVYHEDFYEDTERIGALDARLNELGVAPAGAAASPVGSSA